MARWQELGETLRAERERQGRSLEDVYRVTRITVRYLDFLERGEFDQLPGEVYLKGFLRRYAEYLGLDGEDVLRRYQELKAADLPAVPPVSSAPPARRVRLRLRRSPGRPALKSAAAVLALALAAAATGWAVALWSVRPSVPPKANGPEAAREARPAASPASESAPKAAAEPAAAPPTAPVAPVRVGVKLSDRCWFRVVADGRVVYEGELEAGAVASWTAQERLSLKIGNPPGVSLTWNDQAIEVAGREPVTKVFTAEGPVPLPARPPATAAPSGSPEEVAQPSPPTAPSSPESTVQTP